MHPTCWGQSREKAKGNHPISRSNSDLTRNWGQRAEATDILLDTSTNDGLNLIPFNFYAAHSQAASTRSKGVDMRFMQPDLLDPGTQVRWVFQFEVPVTLANFEGQKKDVQAIGV